MRWTKERVINQQEQKLGETLDEKKEIGPAAGVKEGVKEDHNHRGRGRRRRQ